MEAGNAVALMAGEVNGVQQLRGIAAVADFVASVFIVIAAGPFESRRIDWARAEVLIREKSESPLR